MQTNSSSSFVRIGTGPTVRQPPVSRQPPGPVPSAWPPYIPPSAPPRQAPDRSAAQPAARAPASDQAKDISSTPSKSDAKPTEAGKDKPPSKDDEAKKPAGPAPPAAPAPPAPAPAPPNPAFEPPKDGKPVTARPEDYIQRRYPAPYMQPYPPMPAPPAPAAPAAPKDPDPPKPIDVKPAVIEPPQPAAPMQMPPWLIAALKTRDTDDGPKKSNRKAPTERPKPVDEPGVSQWRRTVPSMQSRSEPSTRPATPRDPPPFAARRMTQPTSPHPAKPFPHARSAPVTSRPAHAAPHSAPTPTASQPARITAPPLPDVPAKTADAYDLPPKPDVSSFFSPPQPAFAMFYQPDLSPVFDPYQWIPQVPAATAQHEVEPQLSPEQAPALSSTWEQTATEPAPWPSGPIVTSMPWPAARYEELLPTAQSHYAVDPRRWRPTAAVRPAPIRRNDSLETDPPWPSEAETEELVEDEEHITGIFGLYQQPQDERFDALAIEDAPEDDTGMSRR